MLPRKTIDRILFLVAFIVVLGHSQVLAQHSVQGEAQPRTQPQAPDSNATLQNTILSVHLSGSELYDNIVKSTVNELDQKARDRETERWNKIYIIVAIFLGFFSIIVVVVSNVVWNNLMKNTVNSVLSDIRNSEDLQDAVDKSIREVFDAKISTTWEAKIEDVNNQINTTLKLLKLTNITLYLDLRDSVKNTDAKEAVRSFVEAYDDNNLISSPEFSGMLKKTVNSLFQARYYRIAHELLKTYKDFMAKDSDIAFTGILLYSRMLLSNLEYDDEISKYLNIAVSGMQMERVPRLTYAFQVVIDYAFKRGDYETRVNVFLNEYKDLDQIGKNEMNSIFLNEVERVKTLDNVSIEDKRVAMRVEEFLRKYDNIFGEILGKIDAISVPENGD